MEVKPKGKKYELEVGDSKSIWIKFTVPYIGNLILDIGRTECLDIAQRGSRNYNISPEMNTFRYDGQ